MSKRKTFETGARYLATKALQPRQPWTRAIAPITTSSSQRTPTPTLQQPQQNFGWATRASQGNTAATQPRHRNASTTALAPINTKETSLVLVSPNYDVELNDVTRDEHQGPRSNRVPPTDPDLIGKGGVYPLWGSLNADGPARFGSIEYGGAWPQVTEVFLTQSSPAAVRGIRSAAPNTPIRPLWRGGNTFLLAAASREDLRAILTQLAKDTCMHNGAMLPGKELLRIKAFDSQGIMEELETTFEVAGELRAQGFPISVEIAMPFAEGKGISSKDPYSDSFYTARIEKGIRLALKNGLPLEAIHVSLKDMVGQLSEERARALIPKIIDTIRTVRNEEIQRQFNEQTHGLTTVTKAAQRALLIPKLEEEIGKPKFGLHCHDTGLALDAYVAAIKAATSAQYPINVDTVGGTNPGFVNTRLLADRLKRAGIDLGLTTGQYAKLDQIDAKQDNIVRRYAAATAPSIFTGEEIRRYAIPGGGEGSFITAVQKSGLAAKLGFTSNDDKQNLKNACHVIAAALVRFGEDGGFPFPVTPGFQNKQITALHLVNNMLSAGMFAGVLGNREAIQQRLYQKPTADEINIIYKDLPPIIVDFMRGEMPAQDQQRSEFTQLVARTNLERKLPSLLKGVDGADEIKEQILRKPTDKNAAHAVLRRAPMQQAQKEDIIEQVGKRTRPLTYGAESKLESAIAAAKELQTEGVVRNDEQAFGDAVFRLLILTPNVGKDVLRHPEKYREIDPTKYSSREDWLRINSVTQSLKQQGLTLKDAEALANMVEFYCGKGATPTPSWVQSARSSGTAAWHRK